MSELFEPVLRRGSSSADDEMMERPDESTLAPYIFDLEFGLFPDFRVSFDKMLRFMAQCFPAANRMRVESGKDALAIRFQARPETIAKANVAMNGFFSFVTHPSGFENQEIPMFIYFRAVKEATEEEIVSRMDRVVGEGQMTPQDLERDLQTFVHNTPF